MTFKRPAADPPGLKPGELALVLDDGSLVAVALVTSLLPNGGGVAVAAEARLIAPDGSTVHAPCGTPVSSGASHSCDAVSVERHGVPALTREVLLLVLGEPGTEGEDGVPIIAFSDEMRVNASIRTTITWADSLVNQVADPAAVLNI